MTEPAYRIDFRFGTVKLAEPTGRWVQDPDGWWREIWTDSVWLDEHGVETRREAFQAPVRMNMPPWAMETAKAPLWRRILRAIRLLP